MGEMMVGRPSADRPVRSPSDKVIFHQSKVTPGDIGVYRY
jgi:hypothetical protein